MAFLSKLSTKLNKNPQSANSQPQKQSQKESLLSIFYSFWVILPIMFFYALSCAVATFIENDYGTIAARAIVYNSWWFALLHIYLIVALIASFIHYRSLPRKKYASALLHLSFIIIIIGAGITRYFGKEGMFIISENQKADFYYSSENYINISAIDENWQKAQPQFVSADISVYGTFFAKPKINEVVEIFGKPLHIVSKDIALTPPNPQEENLKNREMLLTLEVSYNGDTQEITLLGGLGGSNEHRILRVEIGGMKFGFHWGAKKVALPFQIRLLEFEKKTYAGTENPSSYASQIEVLDENDKILFPFRIYMNHTLDFGGYRFYQSNYYFDDETNSYTSVLSVNNDPGKIPTYIGYALLILAGLLVLFDKNGRFRTLAKYLHNAESSTQYNEAESSAKSSNFLNPKESNTKDRANSVVDSNVDLKIDSKANSKAKSKIDSKTDSTSTKRGRPKKMQETTQPKKNTNKTTKKSTLKSLGIALASLALIATTQNTIADSSKAQNIQTHSSSKQATQSSTQNTSQAPQNPHPNMQDMSLPSADSLNLSPTLEKALNDARISPYLLKDEDIQERQNLLKANASEFQARFGKIQVQDFAGRIKPFDTIAMEFVHKIHKKDGFSGLSNVEVLLGIIAFPNDWMRVKFIATDTPRLREILGTPKDKKYVSWLDIYDSNLGESKLHNYLAETSRIPASEHSKFDKDVIAVSERFEIFTNTQNLLTLRIFPDRESKRWFSPSELMVLYMQKMLNEEQSKLFEVQASMINMLQFSVLEGTITNSWKNANIALKAIESYQESNGGSDYLSQSQVEWEVALNHYNIFEKLIFPYMILGFAGFIVVLVFIVRDRTLPKGLYYGIFGALGVFVLAHSFGLILRWYVAGHAPWSDAYESMLYIAWASGIAGVVFFRRYILALCASSFLSGISLFVAHAGFMNPQITNLVPVLKSYWLNIHVSVITAGYGFLGLCFMLGVFSLVLFLLRSKRRANIDKAIFSVGAINEMSMILGILFLTIGNFLGAVWANESWGRYWGWDPKETWALISIGIYAIVLHLRFMGFANMPFVFASASVLAFYSILMTYFGVNYFLSGKHSYASGDPIVIQWYVYAFVLGTIALIVFAFFKRKLKGVY
ncbi:cytochrome c-type biogenesis protein CcsB [Helicobacter macacae MIT 99-5501]|uniref:Cytochrome c-type biogenesis protein CcsB n=1 Tax=Helicobacter macacae MIT 99-5501 TaxID=1357400 RepID=V8C7K5_9HELI|nr:cytochrome c biogenesis protein CcsA [Helicobacter macacae]ETD23359.1 cytochrome c-type biogenesis protein CcsB [Helicobacter macacae MIT 99-5501]